VVRATNLYVKVVIVEDHVMTGDVLSKLCTTEFACHLIAQVSKGVEATDIIIRGKPELVLLDLMLPDISGFEVVEAVRRQGANPRVLGISARCDDFTVSRVERQQFCGFVDKCTATLEELYTALGAVTRGGSYFSGRFQEIQSRLRTDPNAFDKILTEREQSVLELIAGLLSDREIGERLGISEQTSQKHRFNILHKLRLESRTALLRYAESHGLIPFTPSLWRRRR